MKRKLLIALILLSTAFASPTVNRALILPETELIHRYRMATQMSDMFALSHDTELSAFFQGRESVYQELIILLNVLAPEYKNISNDN